jgi:hypothetical protein
MKWSGFEKICSTFNGTWRKLKLSRLLCPTTSEKRLSFWLGCYFFVARPRNGFQLLHD